MSSSGVMSKKSRIKLGIAVVVIIHAALFYGFWHVKAKQIGDKIFTLDVYGNTSTDGFSFYEARPDSDCLDVVHEQTPKPTLQMKPSTPVAGDSAGIAKTQEAAEPFAPQLPIQPARAAGCIKATPPPEGYQKLGEKGFVGLEITLDKTGKIVRGEIDRTSGFADLDTAALKQVVETWGFEPCKKASQAVGCKQYIKFKWKEVK